MKITTHWLDTIACLLFAASSVTGVGWYLAQGFAFLSPL